MAFIPKKLRDLFKKKAKPKKSDILKDFLQEEGYYLFKMKIDKTQKNEFIIRSSEFKDFIIFYKMDMDLASLIILNASVQATASIRYGLNNVSVFFKHKNSDLYINAKDKNIGLPAGSDYQIVLIPKNCKWRPKAKPAEEYSGNKPTVLKPPM